MTEKNNKNTEKSINELEILFLLDLMPETQEEAQAILQNTDIDTTELKKKGRMIFRNMLVEFDDDWRNVPEETLENEASKILGKEVRTNVSRDFILRKISEVSQILNSKGLLSPLITGVAHRNLEKDSDQDLASLLRQLEHIAEEAGIELGEE